MVQDARSRKIFVARDVKLDEVALLNKNRERFERYFTRHESNSQPKKLISQSENLYSQNEKLISETQDVTSDEVDDELPIDVTETLNEPVESEIIDTDVPTINETELPATPQPLAKDRYWEIDSSNIVDKPRRSKLLLNRIYYCYKLTMARSVLPPNKYRDIHFRSDKDAWLKAYQLEHRQVNRDWSNESRHKICKYTRHSPT